MPLPAQNELTDVGGLTGAVLAAAMAFAYVWSKFRRDNSENTAAGNLYNTLSEQVTKLTERLDLVEKDRDSWQAKAMELERKLLDLSRLEEINNRLIKRLDDKDAVLLAKDEQLANLLQEASIKSVTIQNLTERVHDLELRLVSGTDCDKCELKVKQTENCVDCIGEK